MMRETIVYNSSVEFLVQIMEKSPDEICILCPHCRNELVFAPTWEHAKRLAVHPGVYCPTNRKHVSSMFELQPETAGQCDRSSNASSPAEPV